MKIYGNTVVAIFLVVMIACNNDGSQKPQEETSQSPDTAAKTDPGVDAPELVNLKEMEITTKTIIDSKQLSASRRLNRDEINKIKIASIDSMAAGSDDAFKYHVLDTLFSGSKFKILLIGREYAEENILWIASYDHASVLLDRIQVYYDNAEGNLSVMSVVKDNLISVNTQNEYVEEGEAVPKKQVHMVSETGRFVNKS